jgi:hypothetical protein
MIKKDDNKSQVLKISHMENRLRLWLMKIRIRSVMLVFAVCAFLIIGSAILIAYCTD